MFNIIKADFYKLWKSKILLWITLGFLGILLLGNGLAQGGDSVMTLMSDSMNYNLIHFDKKGTQMMIELLKGSNVILFFLIPIIINVFISDFKYKTIKNTVSYQYSRITIYLSKMLVCALFALILPVLYVVLGLVMSILFNGFVSIQLSDLIIVLKIIVLQLPLYIGFIGVMIFIGILFKSNMATTLFTVLYQFIMIFVSEIVTSIHLSEIDPVTCLDHLAYLNSLSATIICKTEFVGFILIILSLILGIYVFCYRDIA